MTQVIELTEREQKLAEMNKSNRWYQLNKDKSKERINAANKKYPERKKARGKAWHAKKSGTLVQPARCEWCQDPKARLCMHHHDYRLPLDITWVCYSCHNKESYKNRKR